VVRQQQELRADAGRGHQGAQLPEKQLAHASVGRVLIERPAKDARITIFSARRAG